MINAIGRTKIKISEINQAVQNDYQAFFKECDQSYENKLRKIADRLKKDAETPEIIMMSGPSSSGKTTTSLKIQRNLLDMNIKAVTISLDDFFKGRDETPILPDGSKDFESINALDIDLLEKTLTDLVYKGKAQIPIFDFKKGKRSDDTKTIELVPGSVAVVEGLHALDTTITGLLPPEYVMKLYVSVSSDFIDDNGKEILTARDVRLIRRTIRDYKFRGSSPENTLSMWDKVCKGEDMYIRPFKKYADVTVNSAFKCEPNLFSESARKLFGSVPKTSAYFERAARITEALTQFETMPMSILPGTSLLREFTGGSVYY